MKANFGSTDKGKRSSYSVADKRQVVMYAQENSQAAAARKFSVHKSMVSRWLQDSKKIELADPTARRITTPNKPTMNGYKDGYEAPKRRRKSPSYYSSSDSDDESLVYLSDSVASEEEESRSDVVADYQGASRPLLPNLLSDSRSSSSFSTAMHGDSFEIDNLATPQKPMSALSDAADETAGFKDDSLEPQYCLLPPPAAAPVPIAAVTAFEYAPVSYCNDPSDLVVSLLKKKRKTRSQIRKRKGPRTKRCGIPASPARSSSASSARSGESAKDRRGMSTLLHVPAVAAHISVSNIMDAAKYLSNCEQEELKITFESLRLLSCDTARYRYLPVKL